MEYRFIYFSFPILVPNTIFVVFFGGGELPANIYYFGLFTVRHTVIMSLTRDEDREGKHQPLDITSTHPKCQKVNLMRERKVSERCSQPRASQGKKMQTNTHWDVCYRGNGRSFHPFGSAPEPILPLPCSFIFKNVK